MRHNVSGRQFGRTANQRKALLRGLATAVIEHERIETTVAKAKEARRIVEKLVTLAKRGDLNSRRVALSKLPNRKIIQKLFDEIAPRFAGRSGGYMRIVHTRQRVNDRAEMAVLEFVDYEDIRDRSAPDRKKAAPAVKKEAEAAKPKAGEKAPAKKAEEETKKEKKAAPKAEEKAPAKKKAAPKAEEKAPAKKKAAPKDKEKAPAKKKAAPKEKE
jgi:large subunit ribosomal protein L17